MTNKMPFAIKTLCAFLLCTSASQATLIDRGGGLIYDDVLNVTWMQDAQYSITSGYADSGRLTWTDANSWASSVQYFDDVRGVVWDDWRLPATLNDLSSLGYDETGLSSELAFMYYVNLGYAPNYSHDRFDPAPVSDSYNPFVNLAYRGYWSQTLSDFTNTAWMLHFHFGSQELNAIGDEQRVWLLRDGDVSLSVPEPGTLALLGLGLLGAGCARRKKISPRKA